MSAGKADSLHRLLERLSKRFTPEQPMRPAEPLEQLVDAMLLWETTTSKARQARKRLEAAFVDWNDLRVAVPSEVVAILGPRYPKAEERALRIRAALNDLFHRQHHLSLDPLLEAPKREARLFLESLDGVPLYVAARVALISLGAHAAPVDERLLGLLAGEGIFEEDVDVEEATAQLERRVRAAESLEAHLLLQAWSDNARTRSQRKQSRSGAAS